MSGIPFFSFLYCKKNFFVFLAFISISTSNLHSQHKIDCIYFNDGTVIRGHVMSSTSDSIAILTLEGNYLILSNKNFIYSVKSTLGKENKNYISLSENRYGWFSYLEPSIKVTWVDELGVGLSFYKGRTFKSNFSLALGLGIFYRPLYFYRYSLNQYRISALARYDLPLKGSHPFISCESGLQTGRNASDLIKPLFYNTTIGYQFLSKGGNSKYIGLGLTQNSEHTNWNNSFEKTHELVLKIGFKL